MLDDASSIHDKNRPHSMGRITRNMARSSASARTALQDLYGERGVSPESKATSPAPTELLATTAPPGSEVSSRRSPQARGQTSVLQAIYGTAPSLQNGAGDGGNPVSGSRSDHQSPRIRQDRPLPVASDSLRAGLPYEQPEGSPTPRPRRTHNRDSVVAMTSSQVPSNDARSASSLIRPVIDHTHGKSKIRPQSLGADARSAPSSHAVPQTCEESEASPNFSDKGNAQPAPPPASSSPARIPFEEKGKLKSTEVAPSPANIHHDVRDHSSDLDVQSQSQEPVNALFSPDDEDEDEYPYSGILNRVSIGHLDQEREDSTRSSPRNHDAFLMLRQCQDEIGQLRWDINTGFDRVATTILALGQQRVPRTGLNDPGSTRYTYKVNTHPTRRSHGAITLANSVRVHLKRLLHGDEFSLNSIATADNCANFSLHWNIDGGRTCRLCCTTDDFRIDLRNSPMSPWNRSASRVFVQDFIYQEGLSNATRVIDDVTKAFFTRVKTLKAKYVLHHSPSEARREAKQRARRLQRKRTLFHRRLSTAQENPALQHHVHILERLGPDGMSSDESDREDINEHPERRDETPVYRVLHPIWRAQNLSSWLAMFDSAHTIHRRSAMGYKEAWARTRATNIEDERISTNRKFVPRLPINTYDPRWLANTQNVALSVLPDPESYDFSYHLPLVEYEMRDIEHAS